MRLVKEIPHPHYLVQIHEYNGKFILKITLDQFEQVFKIPTIDVESLDVLELKLSNEFWSSCLHRFISMRDDEMKYLR